MLWSYGLLVVAFAVLVLATNRFLTLVRHPPYLTLPLVLSLYIPISIVFLLPLDLVSSHHDPAWYTLPTSTLSVLWKVNYWLAFGLTWAVLPLFQDFYDSGYRGAALRLRDLVRLNLKFQGVLLAVGLLGVVYLVLTQHLSAKGLKLLAMTLSHCYSLLLATWFMSFGLVNLPRGLWKRALFGSHLQDAYESILESHDRLEDARDGVQERVNELVTAQRVVQGSSELLYEYLAWIAELVALVPPEFIGRATATSAPTVSTASMADLQHSLNKHVFRFLAAQLEFHQYLHTVVRLQDILGATDRLTFRLEANRLTPRLRYLLHAQLMPWVYRFCLAVLTVLSVLIVWLEMVHSTRLSIVDVAVTKLNHSFPGRALFSTLFLSYMCWCSLVLLSRNKLFGLRFKLSHGNSSPVACFFYASYACRLTLPLSYNFLTLLVDPTLAFETFFAPLLQLTEWGADFNTWLPRFILIPLALTYLDAFEWLRGKLGLKLFEYLEDDEVVHIHSAVAAEAQQVVNRELRHLEGGTRELQLPTGTAAYRDYGDMADEQYRRNQEDIMEGYRASLGAEPQPTEAPTWGARVRGLFLRPNIGL